MKTIVTLCLFLFAMSTLGGCALSQNIGTYQLEDRVVAAGATDAAILSTPAADRPAVARDIYDVSSSIYQSTTTGSVNLTAVDQLVNTQIANWNSPYADVVAGLAALLEQGVQADVNNYLSTLPQTTQDQDINLLIQTGAQAIMNTSLVFTGGVPVTPATLPAATHRKAGDPIVVIHHTWVKRSAHKPTS